MLRYIFERKNQYYCHFSLKEDFRVILYTLKMFRLLMNEVSVMHVNNKLSRFKEFQVKKEFILWKTVLYMEYFKVM